MAPRNRSNAKGVYEYKIDFGLSYRIYFGKDGDALVILLGGGTKAGPITPSPMPCTLSCVKPSNASLTATWKPAKPSCAIT